MKIVDRITFLSLPRGTIYAKFFPDDSFSDLCIKGETWGKWEKEDVLKLIKTLEKAIEKIE